MAVATGIAPSELMSLDLDVWNHMLRVLRASRPRKTRRRR